MRVKAEGRNPKAEGRPKREVRKKGTIKVAQAFLPAVSPTFLSANARYNRPHPCRFGNTIPVTDYFRIVAPAAGRDTNKVGFMRVRFSYSEAIR